MKGDEEKNPIGFVNGLSSQKHVVLFYEDETYANRIEFRLIEQGLRKKERGIFATFGDVSDIEGRMERYGIDVEHFKSQGLLRIVKLEDPMKNPEGLRKGLSTEVQRMFDGWGEGNFRVVGRPIPKIETEDEIRASMEAERLTHLSFKEGTGAAGRNLILFALIQ
ncbi:MAG: MEDS domain-containing protein [Nitrososphaerales archaeon]